MAEYNVRILESGEIRTAFDVVLRSLHRSPVSDETWAYREPAREDARVFGAYHEAELIGAAFSIGAEIAVPGGARLPMAAVNGVGVRADHRRRGVLTSLMRAQLDDIAERGEVMASLRASETAIYGRYGYGVGTRARALRVRRNRAAPHPDVAERGEVRELTADRAIAELPGLYERIGLHRPGMMSRPDAWWGDKLTHALRTDHSLVIAMHTGPSGPDGFVGYRKQDRFTLDEPTSDVDLHVKDLHAASTDALAGLWRYLLRVDLVADIYAFERPLDEPIELLLSDPRACRTQDVTDHTWHRILDVPAALAARDYAPEEPVVLEVADGMLERNSGRYLVGPSTVERTGAPAQLRLPVDVLSMIYFGTYRPSLLAEVGRIEVLDAAALDRADRLFATQRMAWCGTAF